MGDIATETETTFTAKPLIEHWDGSTWSIVPSPVLSGATDVFLSGVSCTSSTSCFAVGASSSSPATFLQFVGTPLVERWDGSTWSIVPSSGPSDALEAELLGVSCVSASSCYAVGDFQAPAIGGALLEHWNGANWSVVPNPDSSFARKSGSGRRLPVGFARARSSKPQQIGEFSSSPGLQGVSCTSDANCFAVGNSFTGALVERWNGTAWSNVTTPTPRNSLGADLGSVACTSPTDCSAVGTQGAVESSGNVIDIADAPLQEHWDGSAFTIVPGPGNAPFSELSGVACGSPTECFAVGDSAFVQLWNGSKWSLAPFGSPTSQSQLNQVACTSATNCFAVGGFESNVQSDTLIERWNGSTWSKVPSPTPSGSFDAVLIGVSCSGPTFCVAVGSYGAGNGLRTLVERWNGSSWTVTSSPTPQGAEIAQLTGVACPSATNCNAVGLGLSLTGAKALVEHWNGRAWSIVPTPSPERRDLPRVGRHHVPERHRLHRGRHLRVAAGHTLTRRPGPGGALGRQGVVDRAEPEPGRLSLCDVVLRVVPRHLELRGRGFRREVGRRFAARLVRALERQDVGGRERAGAEQLPQHRAPARCRAAAPAVAMRSATPRPRR